MSSEIHRLIADVLNIDAERIDDTSSPSSIGEWDSLAHIAIVSTCEEVYGVRFTMSEIVGFRNAAEIAAALEAKGVLKTG